MTPSEIADWLEKRGALFDEEAAATIRELEDDRDQEIRTREATSELLAETEAKLKIATEALEAIENMPAKVPLTEGVGVSQAMRYGLEVTAKKATQALARIKEVGA